MVSTFQHERLRAKKLLAEAADALVRERSTASDGEVQEELDVLQLNESTPFVGIDHLVKVSKAVREEDWSALEADRSLSAWVVGTLKRCVTVALSNDADQFQVLRNVVWRSTDFLRWIVALHNDAGSVTLLYLWWRVDIKPGNRRRCDWWCAACGGPNDWREANRALTIHARCMPEDTWASKAHAPPPGACDNMTVAFRFLANLQEKEHLYRSMVC